MGRYEINNFNYFDTLVRYMRAQPVNLGGINAPSGGQGGGPGYIGYLPQTRVAYDETEAESLTTAVSGSLLDNLNHIRYRVNVVEDAFSGINNFVIKEDGVIIASGITVIDFINDFTVTNPAAGQVTVSLVEDTGVVALSGVHGEDLTSQIGASQTHFDTDMEFAHGFLRVYYNGLRQDPSFIDEDGDALGFTTLFVVYSGDAVVVDYDIITSGTGSSISHGHSQYVTLTYLEANYLTSTDVTDLLVSKSDVGHTHVEADITDLSHDADFIKGIPVSGISPNSGDVLSYSVAGGGVWTPIAVSGILNTVHQQAVFYAIGSDLRATATGVKPMRIYVHDVGLECSIEEIFIAADTKATGQAIRIDILKNGTSILNSPNYIELAVDTYTVSETSFNDTILTKDDYLQWELIQGDAGVSDVSIHIRFQWEL